MSFKIVCSKCEPGNVVSFYVDVDLVFKGDVDVDLILRENFYLPERAHVHKKFPHTYISLQGLRWPGLRERTTCFVKAVQ